MCRPFDSSILRASISSSRVISASGTALSCVEPARNTSSDVVCSVDVARPAAASSVVICEVAVLPSAWAAPFGSMIMITEPSSRIVLPENIAICRSLLDIGFTTISSV